jgi:hypothetical protein
MRYGAFNAQSPNFVGGIMRITSCNQIRSVFALQKKGLMESRQELVASKSQFSHDIWQDDGTRMSDSCVTSRRCDLHPHQFGWLRGIRNSLGQNSFWLRGPATYRIYCVSYSGLSLYALLKRNAVKFKVPPPVSLASEVSLISRLDGPKLDRTLLGHPARPKPPVHQR